MLVGIAIFVLGSTLCGAAQSMEALVLFRAVQGLGGGAIYALSFIVVGVLFPPQERAKMQGIISGIWGVAAILGPLAGVWGAVFFAVFFSSLWGCFPRRKSAPRCRVSSAVSGASRRSSDRWPG